MSLGNLTNLKTIYIYGNKLAVFPQQLLQLHQLKYLYIYGNPMNVSADLPLHYNNLKWLYVSKSQLGGQEQQDQLEKLCQQRGVTLYCW